MRTYFQPSYLRYFLRYFLVTRSLSPRFCRPRRIITRHMRTPRVYFLDAHALFYSLSISCHDNFCNPYTPLPPQLVRFSTIFFFFLPRFHASNHVACLCYVDTRVLVNRAERSFYAEKIIFLTSWQLRPL